MTLEVSAADVVGLGSLVTAALFEFETVDGIARFSTKVAGQSIRIGFTLAATDSGSVKLTIGEATMDGLSVFGTVRKKARQVMLQYLALAPFLSAVGTPDANILLSLARGRVDTVSISPAGFVLGVSL